MFDDRLPQGNHTEIDLVPHITNTVTPVRTQLGVSTDEPEKDVSIEEEPHVLSNAWRMSSGKGASKSSGTVNSPAHNPNGRMVLGCPTTGLTSAIGCPARTIITVSPASTRCR